MKPTPSMEDYLEKVYLLIKNKGYARSADMASLLDVNPSSVTKMIQKLGEMGYINYEKYRGITLTTKGEQAAKSLVEKHQILEELLRRIGVDEDKIYHEVEGIEHYISDQTVERLSNLIDFFNKHQAIQNSFMNFRNNEKKHF
ncbi:transcriptional regulator MntR [Bacillus taeanensis]|uniref:Manganese transport regulator n=1 Tax=Bacillus taeanensis TaxID=273032 RepID=A0A366Y0E3_9BACI|nr:transcriptional regulator MntR [Bacillus taeanensis]RBW69631.1 transcriptional regulator MntR [Bacillus taeanensis]